MVDFSQNPDIWFQPGFVAAGFNFNFDGKIKSQLAFHFRMKNSWHSRFFKENCLTSPALIFRLYDVEVERADDALDDVARRDVGVAHLEFVAKQLAAEVPTLTCRLLKKEKIKFERF